MHITLVDDSLPFDGFSPQSRPLGGAEKAFVSLAGALARRGHDVHAFNRTPYPLLVEGVQWEPLDGKSPTQTDVLIAWRKPSLLPFVRMASKRLLWVSATARQMAPARKALESYQPELVLQGRRHAEGFDDFGAKKPNVIVPGVRADYLDDLPTALSAEPTAIVTTHPLHHLDWVLDRWTESIRPKVAGARLVVVSAALAKAENGGEVAEALKPVFAKVQAAKESGVEILVPKADSGMAELYRSARAHLYAGHADDMACWTLMESQAAGLPAVARDLGAAPERILDGQTGQVVPDAEAFANVAVRLLSDDEMFWSMSRDARLLQRGRSWDVVAAEFETIFKGA